MNTTAETTAETTADAPDRSAAPPRGIVCPDCSVKLRVTVTRPAAPGYVVRYVYCPKCHLSARTEERLVRPSPSE